MSTYTKYRAAWDNCKRCPLWETRTNVVFVRGSLPCDVLFVGEAPGVSEDLLGKPFIGPAGKLLDQIIAKGLNRSLRFAITNLIGCLPQENGAKRDPTPASIKACAPKLQELIEIAKPKAIVCVGKLSEKYCEAPKSVVHRAEIIHPAAILRMDVSQQGLAVQRCVVILQDVGESIYG